MFYHLERIVPLLWRWTLLDAGTRPASGLAYSRSAAREAARRAYRALRGEAVVAAKHAQASAQAAAGTLLQVREDTRSSAATDPAEAGERQPFPAGAASSRARPRIKSPGYELV